MMRGIPGIYFEIENQPNLERLSKSPTLIASHSIMQVVPGRACKQAINQRATLPSETHQSNTPDFRSTKDSITIASPFQTQ
jgi:hypothetical protein